jgi:hypothetical protein
MIVERKSIPPIHQRKFLIGWALIAPSPKRLYFPDQRLPSLETFPCLSHYFDVITAGSSRVLLHDAQGFGDLVGIERRCSCNTCFAAQSTSCRITRGETSSMVCELQLLVMGSQARMAYLNNGQASMLVLSQPGGQQRAHLG